MTPNEPRLIPHHYASYSLGQMSIGNISSGGNVKELMLQGVANLGQYKLIAAL